MSLETSGYNREMRHRRALARSGSDVDLDLLNSIAGSPVRAEYETAFGLQAEQLAMMLGRDPDVDLAEIVGGMRESVLSLPQQTGLSLISISTSTSSDIDPETSVN